MKEIGGYFGMEQLISREYYPDLIALNTGRNALLYLLKARKIQKLYLPYFLCGSVADLCDRFGYAYEHYRIAADFTPIFDKTLAEGEYLYIVNYFGQISNEQAVSFRERYGNIIFDNVQAFFQKPVPGIDTVYSCRKFFGVPDGAYLATDARQDEPLPEDRSGHRMKHILGRFEGCASDYYGDFRANDESFRGLELRQMSRLTRNILGAVDYDTVRRKRNENFQCLLQALESRNPLRLKDLDGAYCYPFYCENGMAVKKKLAEKKIYVPTLWPNVLTMEGTLEKDYAENILPLPCDQRYGTADMKYLAEEVLLCID